MFLKYNKFNLTSKLFKIISNFDSLGYAIYIQLT